jgi:O-antigen/teichoic acid export membrane protein
MQKASDLIAAVRTVVAGRGNAAATAQTVLTQFLALGLNAFTSIIVARILGPSGRGEMAAIIMWSTIFTSLLTLGLPSSTVFNLLQKPEHASNTIAAALVLAMLVALLTDVVGYMAIPFWLHKYPHVDVAYARWFLLSSPIPIINLVSRAAMEAKGKFTHSNALVWSGPILIIIGLISLVANHALTPLTAGLAYVLGGVPGMIWLLWEVRCDYAPDFRGIKSGLSRLVKYGIRSWGIDVLRTLANQADQLLIVRFLSPAAMGTYVVAANLARMLGVFQTSSATVLFPRIAAREGPEVVRLTGRTLRIATMCAVIGAVVGALIGSGLLRIVYGVEYAEGGTGVFRILLAEVVLGGATQVLAQAFMALGRPGVVTAIECAGMGIGISLMPLLIPRLGIAGAGVALLTSTSIRFTLTLLCFKPLLKTNPPTLVMTRGDWEFASSHIANFVPASSRIAE